jgi:hypothetical protein
MADHEHQPDAARRMRNLLDVTRVTENLGADLMPADCVVSYTHALDDMMDAMQCKFAIADLEWIWDKRAEGYPRHTEQQRLQAEDWTESAKERRYEAEVGRLSSARNREDAQEYRNTMETMRQVAEEQCDTRERIRESARDDERQTAGASIQHLLQRMDRFEKHLSQQIYARTLTTRDDGAVKRQKEWYKKLLV